MLVDRRGHRGRIGAGRFIYELLFFFLYPLIEHECQAAYCLSVMTSMNKCEKEKKCKEQQQPQMRQINMKTKTVCFIY